MMEDAKDRRWAMITRLLIMIVAGCCLISTGAYGGRVPAALVPIKDTSYGDAMMSDNARSWTDAKGRVMKASWAWISKSKTQIVLLKVNGKKLTVNMSMLSNDDKQYVNDFIAKEEAQGKRWLRGVYVNSETYDDFYFREAAKKIISAKSGAYAEVETLRVFQVIGNNALCYPYKGVAFMHPRRVSDTPIKYVSSCNVYLIDNDNIPAPFYWCGTFNYNTRGGRNRTIDCLTIEPEFAVNNVMASLRAERNQSCSNESTNNSQPRRSGEIKCTGSGFFVTTNGYLVTNHHVVEGGSRFSVLTASGECKANLIYSDADTDLALLKVEGAGFRPIAFSDKRTERLGSTVITIGFPQPGLQGFDPKVTKGVISGERGFKGDVREYQIDASVQPGNSGGPLLNQNGHLIGVVVASLRDGQVVNYAIKKSYLMAFLDSNPSCAEKIILGAASGSNTCVEEVVSVVRESCVLVLNYQ